MSNSTHHGTILDKRKKLPLDRVPVPYGKSALRIELRLDVASVVDNCPAEEPALDTNGVRVLDKFWK
jgi:hypothetical protein